MTFATSIQSLTGLHSTTDDIGIDWTRSRVWEINATYFSRYGLLTGLEETFGVNADVGAQDLAIGVSSNGNIYFTGPSGLNNGSSIEVSGSTLALVNSVTYPVNQFGGGGMASILVGSTNFVLDAGIGSPVIGTLDRSNVFHDTTYDHANNWAIGSRCMICPGKVGTDKIYQLNAQNGSADTPQEMILTSFTCSLGGITETVIGSPILPADVDATWTQIYCLGMSLDQTDGNLLVVCCGQSAATTLNYAIKIAIADASVIWVSPIASGDALTAGNTMLFGKIVNQKLALLSSTPNRITIIDTSSGSSTTYTTGLAGVAIQSPQCYNDAIGGIVCRVIFNNTAGSPTLLNSTPTSFNGWAVLYVDDVPVPPGGRRYLNEHRPVRVIP